MNDINKIPNCLCKLQSLTLPSSYEEALSYQEQLCIITNKLNELISVFNIELDTTIKDYIDNRFNDIMMDSVYEATTETLILYLKK